MSLKALKIRQFETHFLTLSRVNNRNTKILDQCDFPKGKYSHTLSVLNHSQGFDLREFIGFAPYVDIIQGCFVVTAFQLDVYVLQYGTHNIQMKCFKR